MPVNTQPINANKIPDRIKEILNGEPIKLVRRDISKCKSRLKKFYRTPTRLLIIEFCSIKNEIDLEVKEFKPFMDITPLVAFFSQTWSKLLSKQGSRIKSITAQ